MLEAVKGVELDMEVSYAPQRLKNTAVPPKVLPVTVAALITEVFLPQMWLFRSVFSICPYVGGTPEVFKNLPSTPRPKPCGAPTLKVLSSLQAYNFREHLSLV